MVQDLLLTVGSAVAAAVVYGLVSYAQNHEDHDEGFDARKLGATMLVAAGIGVAAWAAGTPVTEAYTVEMLATYGFAVVLVEKFLKAAYAGYQRNVPPTGPE